MPAILKDKELMAARMAAPRKAAEPEKPDPMAALVEAVRQLALVQPPVVTNDIASPEIRVEVVRVPAQKWRFDLIREGGVLQSIIATPES